MSGINVAGLINILGYTVGIALYLMLLVMVIKHPAQTNDIDQSHSSFFRSWFSNGLLVVTAVLGLLWNLGAFAIYGLKGIGYINNYPLISAISFTALGFLPAVVVHSVSRGPNSNTHRLSTLIVIAAYSLSTVAGGLHFYEAITLNVSPSLWALRLLTYGYVALLGVAVISTRRQHGWKRAIWVSALAVFAVSALHLSHHQLGTTDSWYVELTGHHASLPLVLAILYEDYRFAFADIFLKRALALLILVVTVFGVYLGIAAPVLIRRGQSDPRSIGFLLGLWIATALVYPWLLRGVAAFVDRIVLRRVDYGHVRTEVGKILLRSETVSELMDHTSKVMARAVSASTVTWSEVGSEEESGQQTALPHSQAPPPTTSSSLSEAYIQLLESSGSRGTRLFVPTVEAPAFQFEIGALDGGRRLLSDDIAMLESVAIMVARRIDAIRVTHERCEQSLREQEINKLATEAQLRALRAQVNPHFLFNALTTIGYLIQTAPERALETLMKLTSLLRGVLRSDEVVTLEQELQPISSYLDIERARFEERLRVTIDAPDEILQLHLPALIVQPLVENAIKHGIAPSRVGGEVSIRAKLERVQTVQRQAREILSISVADSGVGVSEIDLARGRKRGLGLSNVEERLRWYGGQIATLNIESSVGEGTLVELRLPIIDRVVEGKFGAGSIRERREA